jgi:hypothetical protein
MREPSCQVILLIYIDGNILSAITIPIFLKGILIHPWQKKRLLRVRPKPGEITIYFKKDNVRSSTEQPNYS